MPATWSIDALMRESGVAFGTSGARGLVAAMTDEVCFAYTAAFLDMLRAEGSIDAGTPLAIGVDRRASSPRIASAVAAAAHARGHAVIHAGAVPTPALALHAFQRCCPAVMVTGSHIPEDRNGLKLYRPDAELRKSDEPVLRAAVLERPDAFHPDGSLRARPELPPATGEVERAYASRYVDAFGGDALRGLRVGVYGHSAVGRDLLVQVLQQLGAEVSRLGFSDAFVAVDTEAIRPEDERLAADWARGGDFDAIVSTDGDSDRPLVADATGTFLRGDVAALLCAIEMHADVVVTPVSSNTAVERCGAFVRVVRTRIGSPYVLDAMQHAVADGGGRVVGYEANGGFLGATAMPGPRGALAPLPTRDAFIVIVALLARVAAHSRPLAELVAALPRRYTASDRVQGIPSERSAARIAALASAGALEVARAIAPDLGAIDDVDLTDGLRATFHSGEIVHLRSSGNAPELRCYAEAEDPERARGLVADTLARVRGW